MMPYDQLADSLAKAQTAEAARKAAEHQNPDNKGDQQRPRERRGGKKNFPRWVRRILGKLNNR